MAWDGDAAAKSLFEWAESRGGIKKSLLAKYFLTVEGKGTNRTDYGYPVAKVVNGEPRYDLDGLKAAFAAASGAHTGVVNRSLQRRIVNLVIREFGVDALTEGMQDFRKRHMAKNLKVFRNSIDIGSKIIYEDDDILEIPAVFAKEGVFTGTDGQPRLKTFEALQESAKWFLGVPVTSGHISNGWITPSDRRIGQIVQVRARPEKKDIFGTVRFFKKSLTQEELKKIKSGEPFDGSIGYYTNIKSDSGKYEDATYDAVEIGPYVIVEYAALFDGVGACSCRDGCGFHLNNKIDDCHTGDEMSENIEDVKNDTEQTIKQDSVADTEMSQNSVAVDSDLKQKIEELTEKIREIESKNSAMITQVNLVKFMNMLAPAYRDDANELYNNFVADPITWLESNRSKLLFENSKQFNGSTVVESEKMFDFEGEQKKIWKVI